MHGVFHGRSLPCVYAIVPGKSDSIYNQLFNVILQHVTKHPQAISIDYEKAMENSIKCKILTCVISGCIFHFEEALWKTIQVFLILASTVVRKSGSIFQIIKFYCLESWPGTKICQ